MSQLTRSTAALLFLLSGLGYYLTWHLLLHNDGARLMQELCDNGPHLLPCNDGAMLRKSYTGIALIDNRLTILVLFFYNIIDGSHPNACLQVYHFFGQAPAGYSLLLLEGLRYGNKWRAISFITFWGLAFQLATFAVVIPFYFALQLLTSPTAESRIVRHYLLDRQKLTCIPYSVGLGLLVPTVAVAIPAPSIISYETKQLFLAIWQAFPLWIEVFQQVLPLLASPFTKGRTTVNANTDTVHGLRTVYSIMLVGAMTSRISTGTIAFSAVLFPNIFAQDIGHLLAPKAVFMPRYITSSVKMPSIAAASFQLLQYDELVGAAAIVIWSAALYINASSKKSSGDWMSLIFKGTALNVFAGPHGFAVAAIWARDEIMFADIDKQKKDQ